MGAQDAERRLGDHRLEDLQAMLAGHGDWMPLGSADEQKPAAEVEPNARNNRMRAL